MSVLKKIAAGLKENGYLIIGRDEFLPLTYPTLFVLTFPDREGIPEIRSKVLEIIQSSNLIPWRRYRSVMTPFRHFYLDKRNPR